MTKLGASENPEDINSKRVLHVYIKPVSKFFEKPEVSGNPEDINSKRVLYVYIKPVSKFLEKPEASENPADINSKRVLYIYIYKAGLQVLITLEASENCEDDNSYTKPAT